MTYSVVCLIVAIKRLTDKTSKTAGLTHNLKAASMDKFFQALRSSSANFTHGRSQAAVLLGSVLSTPLL